MELSNFVTLVLLVVSKKTLIFNTLNMSARDGIEHLNYSLVMQLTTVRSMFGPLVAFSLKFSMASLYFPVILICIHFS